MESDPNGQWPEPSFQGDAPGLCLKCLFAMTLQFWVQLLQGRLAPKRDWLSENEAAPRRWGQEKPPPDGSPEPQRTLWVGFHGCSWGFSSSLLNLDSVEYSVWLDSDHCASQNEKGDCIGMAQEDGTCHTSLATKFDPGIHSKVDAENWIYSRSLVAPTHVLAGGILSTE